MFNATVTDTTGGSCDLKQTMRRIILTKINEQTNLSSETQLLSCSINRGENCTTSDRRLSLNSGDGVDFILTLSNTMKNDFGRYKVFVEIFYPQTNLATTIEKTIHLEIGKSSECL